MLGLYSFCQLIWVFRIKPLKVKLLAGDQKATEVLWWGGGGGGGLGVKPAGKRESFRNPLMGRRHTPKCNAHMGVDQFIPFRAPNDHG